MRSEKLVELGLPLAAIALGVALRLYWPVSTDLWQDEIIAATHAVQPLGDVVIDVLRNDTHPPLYFLQLHFWALLGQADGWLTANSLAWSFAGLFSLWWTAKQHYGSRVALDATAIYAVLPTPLYLSDQLRMYAMLAAFTIWAFHFATLIFKDGRSSKFNLVALAGLLVATVFTHAIGSVAVAANGLYALHVLLERKGKLKPWLGVFGIAAICTLPWLANGILHEGNLHEGAGVYGVILNLALTVFGIPASFGPIPFVLGAACFFGVLWLGLVEKKTNRLAYYFLAFPILLSIVVGFAFKPIFKWNFFSTLEAPFIALVLAVALLKGSRRNALVALGCVIVLFGESAWQRYGFHESSGYRYLAKLIRTNARPGDVIYVPQQSNFWGMAWYLVGPHWGSSLKIAAAPSAQWQKVYSLLGPRLVAATGLIPETQMLHGNGFTILTGPDASAQAIGARRIWLVTLPGADPKTGSPPQVLNNLPQRWHSHLGTWVTLYAGDQQKLTLPGK